MPTITCAPRDMPILTALLCLCLSLCLGLGLLASPTLADAATDPRSTVRAVQASIDARDTAVFSQLVDVDQIVDQGARAFVAQAAVQSGATSGKAAAFELPPALALMVASAKDPALHDAVSSLLVRETRTALLYGVESGLFAGKLDAAAPAPGGLLAPVLVKSTPGRKSLEVEGKAQTVTSKLTGAAPSDRQLRVLLHDAGARGGKGETIPLDVRMALQADGTWRMVEVLNLHDLISTRLQGLDGAHR